VLERVTDGVSALASSSAFIVGHIVWFTVWIAFNTIGDATFDRYPFSLLTLAVSLEARDLQGNGRLVNTQASEEPKVDDTTLALVHARGSSSTPGKWIAISCDPLRMNRNMRSSAQPSEHQERHRDDPVLTR